jgi:formylglycine-generating enzyme required for sulfatase activity
MNLFHLLRTAFAIGGCVLLLHGTQANNIQISNVDLVQDDIDEFNSYINFDINWENSWRIGSQSRWDAAWVFVKFRAGSDQPWQHVHLKAAGHSAPNAFVDNGLLTPGSSWDANTNPVLGVFLRRSVDGTGPFTSNGVQLKWGHESDGVSFESISDIQVFAIEMVHVPEGSFYVGSGGTEFLSLTDGSWTGGNRIPYQITSEGVIQTGTTAGSLYRAGAGPAPAGTITASFPKGYKAFYCMKYELTQQQYIDFLNTLTRTQQNNRVQTSLNNTTSITNVYVMSASPGPVRRNGIRCNNTLPATLPIEFFCDLSGNGTGGEVNDGQWLPVNFVDHNDIAAYLDWSGMRPMSEFEFEKSCRGISAPVPDEFAWGTNTIVTSMPYYTLTDEGAATEGIASSYSSTAGNAAYSSSALNPVRVGIFAAHGLNNGRVTAGSSIYGIMELSGNLTELVVYVISGSTFTGAHGNGTLSLAGSNDVANWPQYTGGITYWALKGGSFSSYNYEAPGGNTLELRVSRGGNALYNGSGTDPGRLKEKGGRGVRTAP